MTTCLHREHAGDYFQALRNIIPPAAPMIEFPDKHWLPEHMLPDLERLLPDRDYVMVSDDMEEVDLSEVDYERQKRNHSSEAYNEDENPRQGSVQCQTQ